MWERIVKRRAYMQEVLGIRIQEDVTNKHGNGISQTVSVEERDGACQCMKSIFLHRKQDHETGKAAAGGK